MLDFCSGWGDRLLGSLACNVNYIGCDPNPDLIEPYVRMGEFVAEHFPEIKATAKVHCEAFEDLNIEDKVDFIFTSPPYYDYEIYNGDNTSTNRYKSIIEWYDKFLIYSIEKAWGQLNKGKFMAININNIPYNRFDYTKKMIDDVNMFRDAMYVGVITWGTGRELYPIWVWQKY